MECAELVTLNGLLVLKLKVVYSFAMVDAMEMETDLIPKKTVKEIVLDGLKNIKKGIWIVTGDKYQ